MRILLANPNTSRRVTERIAAVARRYASVGTEIVAVTASSGVPYIATRAEATVGGRATLELMADHHAGCDAAIVAAFGDPGLGGARELLPIPVVGMAEAAMLTACMLGRSFSIVSFSASLAAWYRECVDYHGLAGRLASIRMLDRPVADVATVPEDSAELLVELCVRTVEADGPDVIILGGAPLAGLAERIAGQVPVPLVDGVGAAVRQAETLAALAPRKATAGSFRRPAPKPVSGVPEPLARLFTDPR